jgi:hypothetical protein
MLLQSVKNKFSFGFTDKAKAIKIEGSTDVNKLKGKGFSGSANQLAAGEVTADLLMRIRREAAIVACQGLDKDEIRTKIEWQARQILSR